MTSIEQVARMAIAVYADYCARGVRPDIARENAAKEVAECTEGLVLIQSPTKNVGSCESHQTLKPNPSS